MKYLISLFLLLSTSLFAYELNFMTEEYPPYNYSKDNKVVGLATEIVEEIKKEHKVNGSIEMMKWSKAYNIIQKKPNQVLYVMTRTPAREDLFKWVGPVAENKWVFFAKKGRNLKINNLDDAKKVEKIGTYKDDACEIFLIEQGFKNIDSVALDTQNVKKLEADRIDLWIAGEIQGYFKAKEENKQNILEKVFEIQNTHLYIAFSKDVPDSVINEWQTTLNKMKEDGRYKTILDRYLK